VPQPWWEKLPEEELIDVRLCDLGLRAEEGWLAEPLTRLRHELERSGFAFQPSVWLSTDWFSPHGVPGFAVPFYLAHPRLIGIERRFMFEAEGSPSGWCLKLLRHETGHALDTAYRLRRRKSFREAFGKASTPYFHTYVPLQGSRDFVHNLDDWYAQSHPTEDFAETFAVWLRSRGRWRSLYAGWPALAKLEYVDALMREIAEQRPRVRSREKPDSLPRVRLTLREYYRRKQVHYGDEDRSIYDRDLKRLFTAGRAPGRRTAAAFLRERRLELRRQVAGWTGQRPFVVDEVLRGMIRRCRELDLHLSHSERETSEGAAVLVTLHTARIERMRHREYFR
jgi:hypothetical protein